jgi:hypothetical protein
VNAADVDGAGGDGAGGAAAARDDEVLLKYFLLPEDFSGVKKVQCSQLRDTKRRSTAVARPRSTPIRVRHIITQAKIAAK